MLTKSRDWQDMIQVGKLSRQYIWLMLVKQIWPRVLYGLCAISASYNELSGCLMKVYSQIHLQGRIRRLSRRGIHQFDLVFYGVGCPHPAMILDARIDPGGTVCMANTTEHTQVGLGSNENIVE